VLAGAGLAEERVEAIVAAAARLVGGHLPVRLDPVLQTVQFPAGIPDLHSGLADVYGYTLTLNDGTKILLQRHASPVERKRVARVRVRQAFIKSVRFSCGRP